MINSFEFDVIYTISVTGESLEVFNKKLWIFDCIEVVVATKYRTLDYQREIKKSRSWNRTKLSINKLRLHISRSIIKHRMKRTKIVHNRATRYRTFICIWLNLKKTRTLEIVTSSHFSKSSHAMTLYDFYLD